MRLLIESLLRLRSVPLGRLELGDYTTGFPTVISRTENYVKIGKFCSIAPDVTIIPSLGHIPSCKKDRNFRVSTYPLHILSGGWKSKWDLPRDRNFVFVGNDVWIGTKSILLPGIKIGDGAIIGAGAVVTKDVPPYAIVAGSPAEVIGFRYSKKQISELLRIAWWNWDIAKIKKNIDYFYGDVDIFIKTFLEDKI